MNTPAFPARTANLRFRIRTMIFVFMVSLVVSGITAFPLEWELELMLDNPHFFPQSFNEWFAKVYQGITDTYSKYPFMAYGTDWLGFAHISIAVFFIGAFRYPVRNKWIIISGMIISLMVFPHSFIFGHFEGIPLGWRLIDCSFGFFSFILLWFCYKDINRLEKLEAGHKTFDGRVPGQTERPGS